MDDLLKRLLADKGMSEDVFDQKVEGYQQQAQENPTGIRKNIKLITDQTKINLDTVAQEDEINTKIQSGEIDATIYPTLSTDEQNIVKTVLFKNYSPHLYDVPKKLSAIEFLLVGLLQFADKTMDKSLLTVEEQNYWNSVMSFISNAQQPINDITDWRFIYAQDEFNDTQTNRTNYFVEKHSIVGDPTNK